MMTRQELALTPGGLNAALYDHELPVAGHLLPCWTVVTQGLAPHGQREIALTVLKTREARDNMPPGVFGYIRSLNQLAEQGSLIDAGGISSWKAPGPLGMGGFVGVAFFDSAELPGVLLPSDALTGVFLKEGEVEMATRCGVQRVLYALGRQVRYFPFPYWSDPGRDAVFQLGDAARSVLYKFDRVAMPSATATVTHMGERCLLRVPGDGAILLADTLELRGGAAVQPGRDLALSAALVWNPAQTQPQASAVTGKDPSELAATFVTLVIGDDPTDRVTFLEDGFGALLSRETAARLLTALRKGEATTLLIADARRTLILEISAEPAIEPANPRP